MAGDDHQRGGPEFGQAVPGRVPDQGSGQSLAPGRRVCLDVLKAGEPAGQRHQAELRDQAAAGKRPEPGRVAGRGQLPPGGRPELDELVILWRGCVVVRGAARGPQLAGPSVRLGIRLLVAWRQVRGGWRRSPQRRKVVLPSVSGLSTVLVPCRHHSTSGETGPGSSPCPEKGLEANSVRDFDDAAGAGEAGRVWCGEPIVRMGGRDGSEDNHHSGRRFRWRPGR